MAPVARRPLQLPLLVALYLCPLAASLSLPSFPLNGLQRPDPELSRRLRHAVTSLGAFVVLGPEDGPSAHDVAAPCGPGPHPTSPSREELLPGALLHALHPEANTPISKDLWAVGDAYLRFLRQWKDGSPPEGEDFDFQERNAPTDGSGGVGHVHCLRRLDGAAVGEVPSLQEGPGLFTVIGAPSTHDRTTGRPHPALSAPSVLIRLPSGEVVAALLPPNGHLVVTGSAAAHHSFGDQSSTVPAHGVAGPEVGGLVRAWRSRTYAAPADWVPVARAPPADPWPQPVAPHSHFEVLQAPTTVSDLEAEVNALTATTGLCDAALPPVVMWMTGFQAAGASGGVCLNLLVPQWVLSTAGAFAGACIGVFLMAVVVEGLGAARCWVQTQTPSTLRRRVLQGATLAGLYGGQVTLGYFVMLAYMSYEIELFLLAILGAMAGYAAFHVDWRVPEPPAPTAGTHGELEACSCAVASCQSDADPPEPCDCAPSACHEAPTCSFSLPTPSTSPGRSCEAPVYDHCDIGV